ncbi:MAG: glutaredoxin family protein [Polyangiales bacterium]
MHRFHRPSLRVLLAALFVASVGPALGACRSKSSNASRIEGEGSKPELPPIVIRDQSTELTFSYITLEGGFKTVNKVDAVPYEARDAVRVWSDVSGDGVAGPYVYVADLRNKLADGSYKCDVFPRAYFDDLAEGRRKKLAAGPTAPLATEGQPPGGSGAPPTGDGKLTVIIYGADWCQPCHQAEAYLKGKGVPFVHKDVDDPNVSEEMQDKLQAAGIQTHSIPVLDVGGKLLVGFEASELDQALRDAKKK